MWKNNCIKIFNKKLRWQMNVIFFTYRIFIDIIMFWPCATFVNVNTCIAHNTFSIIKLSTWIDKSLLLHSLCSVPITTYCGWFLRLNVIIFVHRFLSTDQISMWFIFKNINTFIWYVLSGFICIHVSWWVL